MCVCGGGAKEGGERESRKARGRRRNSASLVLNVRCGETVLYLHS